MTTLIAAYNSSGCTGRCDAKCYTAEGPECDCICGGMNHGKGRDQAMEKTRQMAEAWMERWRAEHPDTLAFAIPAAQLPLFSMEVAA